jgi:tRNA-splicing endonuclease subunit Sen2
VNKRKDGFHRKSKRLKVDGSEEQKLLNCDEHLQLCLEEAFFLVFTFGSLRILDETVLLETFSFLSPSQKNRTEETPPLFFLFQNKQAQSRNLSVSDCWRLFSESQPNFPVSYACYHHYRSNSWTPRGGSKFGADWVLYHKGPSHYHAE